MNKEFILEIGGAMMFRRHHDKFFGISPTPGLWLGIIFFIAFVYFIILQVKERKILKQDFETCKDEHHKKSIQEMLDYNKKESIYSVLVIIIFEFIFFILHIVLVEFTSLF
ncbi:hypothetical protein NNC19_18970 [Clostridium sp. SHJSY1]|uniref:hypothetical protein n=1 Tax=Clostridium sp. SHJSY1 TaxID=2942483 RepID=UPI0028745E17|nr:hypothetical protein [Clostridium sp. SHJSY1]MDS0527777.1 hypothetical protein [Clostridium sp. SHJSY1]